MKYFKFRLFRNLKINLKNVLVEVIEKRSIITFFLVDRKVPFKFKARLKFQNGVQYFNYWLFKSIVTDWHYVIKHKVIK